MPVQELGWMPQADADDLVTALCEDEMTLLRACPRYCTTAFGSRAPFALDDALGGGLSRAVIPLHPANCKQQRLRLRNSSPLGRVRGPRTRTS